MRPVSAALGPSSLSISPLKTHSSSASAPSGGSTQRPLLIEHIAVVRDAREREVHAARTAVLARAHASGQDLVLAASVAAPPRAHSMLGKVLAGLYRIQQPNVVGNYIDTYV